MDMTTVIRNSLGSPAKNIPAARPGTNMVDVIVTVPAAALQNSTYGVITLPLKARLHGVSRVAHGDLASSGSPTIDIGLRPAPVSRGVAWVRLMAFARPDERDVVEASYF
jgi:hypothetical protein